jgi:hypothetical protein
MKTLEEAWAWYRSVADGTKRLAHLSKFWDQLPWDEGSEWVERVKRDSVLSGVSATVMAGEARRVEEALDDLAVLVLFSVFEAIVRDLIEAQVQPEVDALRHPTLVKAGKDVIDALAEGSFFRVLEPYKLTDSDLVERVNQVRRFRNWVAHGRRPDKKPNALVTPAEAHDRLTRFLALLRSSNLAAPS